MRVLCIGGGPAGLYFGLLMKLQDPSHDVVVVERNRPYDTFGWGVVFSDATMDHMRVWDPETASDIEGAFNHWDDIELHFKNQVIRSGGHGFVGIGRKKLLNILQARCEALGVRLLFEQDVDSDLDFPDADLIVASDGIERFLVPSTCVGVRPGEIYAPYGLESLYAGTLAMNPLTPHRDLFEAKAASYQRRWPWLTIVSPE